MYVITKIEKFFTRLGLGIIPLENKKFIRKKVLAMLDKKYLRRYLSALNEIQKNTETAVKNREIIWTCWLQGEEKAPAVVKACLAQMRKMEANRKIVVITRENIRQYVTLPDYIWEKWQKGIIGNTHFSDILRVCLLYEHGGIWLDATAYLLKPIVPKIVDAPFFAYHSRTYLRIYPQVLGNNNWFLVSNPQHPLIAGIRAMLFAYWRHENSTIHYFIYHLMFDLMVENNELCAEEWRKVPLFYDDNEELYENFLKPYNAKLLAEIAERNPVQKLSYKYTQEPTADFTFEKFVLAEK